MKRQLIVQIGIALLILLFTYTAISKILDQYRFVFQMKLSPFFLVKNFTSFWGVAVPALECAISLGLLFERTQRIALFASLTLLMIFEIYIVGMLMTGLKLPCACGGVIAFMSWKVHVLFNAIFITINILTIRFSKREPLATYL